jgi:hypothetical protein
MNSYANCAKQGYVTLPGKKYENILFLDTTAFPLETKHYFL